MMLSKDMNTKFTRLVIVNVKKKKKEKVFQVRGVWNVAAKKSPPMDSLERHIQNIQLYD